MRWTGRVELWGTREVHTGYWWGHLRESDYLEDPDERWDDNIKINLQGMGWDHGLD